MSRYKKHFGLLFICLLTIAVSCKKKTSDEQPEFDKSTLLSNVGNNIILSNYQQLDMKLTDFQQKYAAFVADQTPGNFELARESWKSSYIQWEKSLMFDLGPAMSELLKGYLGTFPSDSTKIGNNIAAGTYDLMQVSNITAQGLPAFDFLLYRNNAISYFSQPAYADYGTALIAKMKGHVSQVLNGWNGGYLSTFISSTGTETTSSFSMFVNEFVKSYEECKWTKLGIPVGKQSMGVQMPEYMEARYSKQSFELMYTNLKALHRLFNGDKEDGTTGVGFDDYLVAIDKGSLAQTINTEFEGILNLINGFTGDFESAMNNNPQALDQLYTKIHNLTIYLKTDMTSSFGVMITYQDNDGD